MTHISIKILMITKDVAKQLKTKELMDHARIS